MKYLIFLLFIIILEPTIAQNDSISIEKLFDKAYELEATNPKEALQLYRVILNKSKTADYKVGITKSLQYTGIVHSDLADYDSAIYYYKKALPFSIDANYRRGTGGLYINIGNAYQYKGQFDKVIENYIKGIKIFETIKDSSRLGVSYENLAAFYSSLKNREKEIEYLQKALSVIPITDLERMAYALGDLGLAYLSINQQQQAFLKFTSADSITKLVDDKRLQFFANRNFGEYYHKMADYEKAITYYDKALNHINSINDTYYKNDVLLQLGQSNASAKNYTKAVTYLNEALQLAKENASIEIENKAHLQLAEIYENLNKPNQAYYHLKLHNQLKDSLLNENHLQQINLLEKQYESEKKDKEIAEQKAILEHNSLELIKKQNKIRLATIGGILSLLTVIGIWLFYQQRQKLKNIEIKKLEQERDLSKLQALIEGEEKERARLAQDLHDGINGDLSSIKFQLSSIDEHQLTTETLPVFKRTIEMIDHSCQQIRTISHNLSPITIRDFGLITSIKNYCTKTESLHPITITFQHFGNDIQLPKAIETVIYRIIQELVNNIIKHANATEALVQLNAYDSNLFITVEDNGIGFQNKKENIGIGLKNIASRIAFLNAQLEEEHHKKGTTFHINIDLNNIPSV